jgi:membrane protein DedA with SNARE-associated domain
MKALSLIAMALAAYLLFLGFSTGKSAGAPLGNALIIGGSIVAGVVVIIWVITFIKEKKR